MTGVRSKMLAIAVWRLILLFPSVVADARYGPMNNPLIANFTSNVTARLTYRSGRTVANLCGLKLLVKETSRPLNFPARNVTVTAAEVRDEPQAQFTGLRPTGLYTWVVLEQLMDPAYDKFGDWENPFILSMKVNVLGGDLSTGLVVASHLPPVPSDKRGITYVTILLFRQPSAIVNASTVGYHLPECQENRCQFQVRRYAADNGLTLVFAAGMTVEEDFFSLERFKMFDREEACRRVWRMRVGKNKLIRDADLRVGIAAGFHTEEVVTEQLCGRVFHYMDDVSKVLWNATAPLKARKVRSLPKVHLYNLDHMDERGSQMGDEGRNMSQGGGMGQRNGNRTEGGGMGQGYGNMTGGGGMGQRNGNRTEGGGMGQGYGNMTGGGGMGQGYGNRTGGDDQEKDSWYTLLLVDQTVTPNNSQERPWVNWVVSNIKNFDLNDATCSVPYFPILTPMGTADAAFLLYKQSEHVEIDPSEYAAETDCPFQYRCNWDIERLTQEKKLKLVGALTFQVSADPLSIIHWVKQKKLSEEEGCRELAKFNHEGRMIGQCSPKYDAWKALKRELDECVMDFKKKMIKERMANMCPELGSHFSNEKGKGGEAMESKDGMMDMKKEEMAMLIKKFIMTGMHEMEIMKAANKSGGEMMKPGDRMMGPHCVQAVMKYIHHVKAKMMNGDDKMDDKPDMGDGGKCMEAAKIFMKEQWEKYQEMKKKEEMKKKMEDDWEEWRNKKEWNPWTSWGKKDQGMGEGKGKWEQMMKEMWGKMDGKKDEMGEEQKMKMLLDHLKQKAMKAFADEMTGGKGKEDEKRSDKEGEGDRFKQMMEHIKEKIMEEFKDKMMGGEGGDKWAPWQKWEKGEKGEKGGEKGEGDKFKQMMEHIKEKMMEEFKGKMMEREGGDKWESWQKWEKGEKGGEKGEGDKFKQMMEHIKEKMMEEFKGKMMEREGGDKWAPWQKWEKGEKGGEKGEGDKFKQMMEHIKEKMMEEFKGKMMEREGGDKWAPWQKWEKGENGGEKGEGDKFKQMMEHIKEKMMEEFKGKMMEREGGDKWAPWQKREKEEKDGEKGEGDKFKQMMEHFKEKMMEEFKGKMMEREGGDKWAQWQKWEKGEKGGEKGEGDKFKQMMEHIKEKMMEEFKGKMMEREGGDKWAPWQKWEKGGEKGDGDNLKQMMEHMKAKIMKDLLHKAMGENDKGSDNEMGDKLKLFMDHVKQKIMMEFAEKMKDNEDEGNADKLTDMLEGLKKKLMMEFWEKIQKCKEAKEKAELMEHLKMKVMEEMKRKLMEHIKMKMMEHIKMKIMEHIKQKMAEEMKKKMMMAFFEKMKKNDEEKAKWDKMLGGMWDKAKGSQESDEDKKYGKMMEEMGNMWSEDKENLSEEEMKEKKMAFLVHALKAFLVKNMPMQGKLEMVYDFFKRKLTMENRCPLTGESNKRPDAQNKCMMMFKEMMMKKKFLEMLQDKAEDMKEEKEKYEISEEKKDLIHKMVAGLMEKMGDKYDGKKDEM